MTHKRPGFSGHVLHVYNRRVDRNTIFYSNEDYVLFRSLLRQAVIKFQLRLLEWVLMPNHWHMLAWPETKNQVSDFVHWLTGTHATIWRNNTDTVGNGSLYQSPYKAVPICPGFHLNTLRNYISMNPVKANLIVNPLDWSWGSASRLNRKNFATVVPLSKGPGPYPEDIRSLLTTHSNLTVVQKQRLKLSLSKAFPYGDDEWTENLVNVHNLKHTTRRVGRPPKSKFN